MAKNATLSDGAGEVRIFRLLIAGRQIVGVATFVESNWGLKKVAAKVHQIAAGVIAGTNHIIDAVIGDIAGCFKPLP